MKSKMPLWRNIIILAVVVAVLIGLLIAVTKMNPSDKESDTPQATQTPSYTAYKADRKDVSKIEVKTAENTLTVKNTGEDSWTLNDVEQENIDSSKLDNLLTTVLTMMSNNEIAKMPADLSEYGLDNPSITINVTLKSGQTDKLLIGNASPTTGEYFFMVNGADTIYSIYSYKVDTLNQPLSYYQSFNRFKIDTSKLVEMKFERRNKPTLHLKMKENIDDTSYNVWTITEPYTDTLAAIDQYVDDKILTPISELTIDTPAQKDGNYGFDNPSAVVTLVAATYKDDNVTIDSTEEQKLILGNTENHVTYVKLNDLNMVFAVSESELEFAYTDEFLAVSKLQGMNEIAKVSKLEVITADHTMTMDIDHVDDQKFAFKVNGADAGDKASKNAYQNIISLYVDGVYKNETLGSPEVTVKYTGYNGNADVLVEYIPINELSYAVRRDGKVQFTIKKSSVEDMLKKIKEYEQNPTAETK